MKIKGLLAILLFLLACLPAAARLAAPLDGAAGSTPGFKFAAHPFGAPQSNPASPSPPPASGAKQAPLQQPAGPFTRLALWMHTTQHALHTQLAKAMRDLKQQHAAAAGFTLVLVSFLYGVLHAAGPGHGKAVISSYVLANERTMRRGIALAFAASFVQALSAITLVGVLAFFLNAAGTRMQQTVAWLETVSYALIALAGGWLFFSEVWRRWPAPGKGHPHAHGHDHHHDDACDCGHHHMPAPHVLDKGFSLRRAAAIVLAVGIRPCTGAIFVLVFALTQGLFWAGVGAAFAMALGTAITVSMLAVIAAGSRDLAVRLTGGSGVWAGRIYGLAALGGSLFILLLGLILFFGSLGPARPF